MQEGREGYRDGDIEAGSEVGRQAWQGGKKERNKEDRWGWRAAWCEGVSVGAARCQRGMYKGGDTNH